MVEFVRFWNLQQRFTKIFIEQYRKKTEKKSGKVDFFKERDDERKQGRKERKKEGRKEERKELKRKKYLRAMGICVSSLINL